jgi:hypothetical protein
MLYDIVVDKLLEQGFEYIATSKHYIKSSDSWYIPARGLRALLGGYTLEDIPRILIRGAEGELACGLFAWRQVIKPMLQGLLEQGG